MADLLAAAANVATSAASVPTPIGDVTANELARGSITTAALIGVIAVVIFAGLVLLRLPKADDVETQKVRFAATTFTGLLLVFVFAAVLYFSDGRPAELNAGKDIFEKAMTAMTPLIGVIVGYLFGTKDKQGSGASSAKSDSLPKKDAESDKPRTEQPK